MDVDLAILEPHKPWTVLANLPYQVTFPILHKIQEYRHCFSEGVVMVQEEVAQKIVKTKGRGYGFISLFLQHFFDWKLLDKIPPRAFNPPPKVFSRLLYFKVKSEVLPIVREHDFWKFIKLIFKQPRRTLKNNLMQSHYPLHMLTQEELTKRAQELTMAEIMAIWNRWHEMQKS